MEPIITTTAIVAAYQAFKKAHPHISNFINQLVQRGVQEGIQKTIAEIQQKKGGKSEGKA